MYLILLACKLYLHDKTFIKRRLQTCLVLTALNLRQQSRREDKNIAFCPIVTSVNCVLASPGRLTTCLSYQRPVAVMVSDHLPACLCISGGPVCPPAPSQPALASEQEDGRGAAGDGPRHVIHQHAAQLPRVPDPAHRGRHRHRHLVLRRRVQFLVRRHRLLHYGLLHG